MTPPRPPGPPGVEPAGEVGARLPALLAAIRHRRPLVHLFANFVTMQAVASVIRAIGALPVMALAQPDAEQMVEHADALVLSLGTPTTDRLEAMLGVGRRAAARGCPIVVDPVGAGSTEFRDTTARRVLDALPVTVIRANRGEAEALLGRHGSVRGVESVAEGHDADAGATARQLARARGCVAAVTGAIDHVAGGDRLLVVEYGHPWLEAVSGAGCMVTALVGAFAAVEEDRLIATTAALACFGLAAERAAQRAAGPGTMVPHLLDALYHFVPEDLRGATRIKEC